MAELESATLDGVMQKARRLPSEFLPALLKVMRAFREGVPLPHAAGSLRQGWAEAQSGETCPIDEPWNDG